MGEIRDTAAYSRFNEDVFSDEVMEKYLDEDSYRQLRHTIDEGAPCPFSLRAWLPRL